MTTLEQQLLDALESLWELHLDAVGKKPRDSKLDIVEYYDETEKKVEKALANAKPLPKE